MDKIRIFENPNFGSVRIITDDASGELLFCASDVTTALGYTNGRDAIAKHVDEGDVAKRDTPIPNQFGTMVNQQVSYVTESGLYSLIFGSKQERAKEFKRWVTSEVLPSIRKTGSYFSNHQTVMDRLQTNITYADWVMKSLNLNQASKILWAKKLGDSFGLMTDAIPQYVNAGTENPTLHAATDLLKKHDVGITAQVFNKQLEARGIVTTATRPGKGGKTHSWKVLRQEYDKFGQNVQDPKFQSQTQIKWYDNTFAELLGIAGVNRERVLTEES